MKLNARTATAADFDVAAQKHANAFWIYLIVAGFIYYLFKWWFVIPAAFAVYAGISSISSTKAASNIRKGTYRIPNPNNGMPD